MFYHKILRPILFKFDPENAHDVFVGFGELAGKIYPLKKLIGALYNYRSGNISKKVDGLTYKTPFILAAGFDCNARLLPILSEISFGGVEVGSVTARPCGGNSKPRMKRLVKSQSILVNKGLRNRGVEEIIKKISRFAPASRDKKNFVVGVSIAKTNDIKCVSVEEGLEDYSRSFKRLNEENAGDYYAINISCPNAFGGETFTKPDLLNRLLSKLSSVPCNKPVYVKMPINLAWQEFDALLKIADKFKIVKGVIIGNLNKNYDSLDVRSEAPSDYQGGLSGKPCSELSNELIKKTRNAYGKRFTIIGCGGVLSPRNMIEKFEAGADLVQLVTGLIWNGPGFVKKLAKEYSKKYD